jgi:hypothetical protein
VAASLGQNLSWKDTGEPDGGRATFDGWHGSMKAEGRRRWTMARRIAGQQRDGDDDRRDEDQASRRSHAPHRVPCAFVELKEGTKATEADIIAFCRSQMSGFKTPKAVVFGVIPKTSTGKIQKFLLRNQVDSAKAISA